ncbi:hypothetical protein [Prosthecobacter sp.]|uniref:hypothetical protein n=1 Tax=Prosthecobacter sp. TaxID=1965333 RepID=UPI002488BE6E|nr:hypothetical protein [Prosthecobacter sp.]MDI1314771.1 hypothetical protein [Prosthecobacter sp.]
MMKISLLLLLTSALSLMSCATSSQPKRQPMAGGAMISFPSQHISFFLPDGWKTLPKTKGGGRLMGAAHDNGEKPGGIVFALITAPDSSHKGVKDPYFTKDFQRAWSQKGFTKFSKPQLVTVGGREAMRFEMQKPGQSMLNYTFIERGQMIGLVFAYYGMPITKGPAVQRIVDSFSIGR